MRMSAKAALLSDAQTLALLGCGKGDCLRPRLCEACNLRLIWLLALAARQ